MHPFGVPFLPLAVALPGTPPPPLLLRTREGGHLSVPMSSVFLPPLRTPQAESVRRWDQGSSDAPVHFAQSQTRLVAEVRFLIYRKIAFSQR